MSIRHFLLGALSGALATTLGFQALSKPAPELNPQSSTTNIGNQSGSIGVASSSAVAPFPRGSSSAVGTATAIHSGPLQVAGAEGPLAAGRGERIQGPAAIQLSAEHAKVLVQSADQSRPPSLAELHMQISAEGKDAEWAFSTEQQIRQYLVSMDQAAEFEVMSVECRTTMCEILAFGNTPASGQRWNQLWDEATKQPWFSSFSGNSTSTFVRNSRYVIVSVLHRSK
jgi:hypothetical protein